MVRARVKLDSRGPVTFHGRGRRLTRGESIIVTNAADIRYFQVQGGFSVAILEGAMPKAPPVEPPNEDDEGDDDDGLELDEDLDADGPADPTYNRGDLNKQTKSQLVGLGAELSVELTMDMSKSAMVNAIVEAQGS